MMKKCLGIFLLVCIAGRAMSQTDEQQAKLKAVFIYNFTRYVEWNTGNDENNFTIAVLGNSPLTAPLIEIAKTNTVDGKRIIIKTYNNPDDIGTCQILFIPQKNPFTLQSIFEHTHRGILTVSEEVGYAKAGTALNFVVYNDKLKFEANRKALEAAGLKASSQLLKLAVIVD